MLGVSVKYSHLINFAPKWETPTNEIRLVAKITVHCMPLVNPEYSILTAKEGVRWCKLLVNLALNVSEYLRRVVKAYIIEKGYKKCF